MSLLAVGISHRTAPVGVLEQVAVLAEDVPKLLDELLTGDNVTEAMLLSTCNRVEVYAVVETFHGGLGDVSAVLGRHSGCEVVDLADYLYVHYAGSAVEHLFTVAAGLDSMVVGEAQILGQLRTAYGVASELGTAGRVLHELAQHGLRVGKRVHSETGIDAAGASVVSEALADAVAVLGGLAGRRALVVGAGAMGALAAAQLRRAGIGEIVVANRTSANAARLAAAVLAQGTAARTAPLTRLADEVAGADVVVTCTGAVGTVLTEAMVAGAVGPLVVCDLGMPHDVDPAVGDLPGVTLVDLAALAQRLSGQRCGEPVAAARRVVADEVRGYLAAQRSAEVTPTVTALRHRAAEVVDAELLRLGARLPGLPEEVRDELAQAMRRVVDKLLHTPTVRVRQLAESPGGDAYAEALRELFELDPQAPAAVTAPRVGHSHGGTARGRTSRGGAA